MEGFGFVNRTLKSRTHLAVRVKPVTLFLVWPHVVLNHFCTLQAAAAQAGQSTSAAPAPDQQAKPRDRGRGPNQGTSLGLPTEGARYCWVA